MRYIRFEEKKLTVMRMYEPTIFNIRLNIQF